MTRRDGAADDDHVAAGGRGGERDRAERPTLEAKVVKATRAGRRRRRSRRARGRPRVSLGLRPSRRRWSNCRRAPARPRRRSPRGAPRRSARPSDRRRRRASSRRCGGRVPSGVRIASAFDSGIECATLMYSTSNGPTVKRLAGRDDGDRHDLGAPARPRAWRRAGRRRRRSRRPARGAAARGRAARRNDPRGRG